MSDIHKNFDTHPAFPSTLSDDREIIARLIAMSGSNVDIQIYDGGVILSNGGLRVRLHGRHLPSLRGLSWQQQLTLLIEALPFTDVEHLYRIGLFERRDAQRTIIIRSAHVSRLATIFAPVAGPWGLSVITLSSLAALIYEISFNEIAKQGASIMAKVLSYGLAIPVTCVLSVILHEIGHASACARFTGSSGAIHISHSPAAIKTDVTSAQHLPLKDKLCVILAGVAFQMLIIPFVFLSTLSMPSLHNSLLFATILVVFHILATLIPLTPNDGSAICRELERTEKWRWVNNYAIRHSSSFRWVHRVLFFVGFSVALHLANL